MAWFAKPKKSKKVKSFESTNTNPKLNHKHYRFVVSGNSDKWIEIHYTVMVPYSELVNMKNYMKQYAELLGWELTYDQNSLTDLDKITRTNVTVAPAGSKISVKEFADNKAKILGFAFSMFRDLAYGGDEKKANENFKEGTVFRTMDMKLTHKKLISVTTPIRYFLMVHTLGFLEISYNVADRVEFEATYPEEALKAFSPNIKTFLKEMFSKSTKKEELELRKELENTFDFKLH
jgi:hypothetical protein